MDFIKHFLLAVAIFGAIDAVWLVAIASKFYKKYLGYILAPKADLKPAVVFYILYIIGLVVFVIDPALAHKSIGYAIGHGALLGLVMYATYDLTNQSTLKKWPYQVTIVDMVWGTFITALVATLSFLILS
jgi:uncharacterized membrane protein